MAAIGSLILNPHSKCYTFSVEDVGDPSRWPARYYRGAVGALLVCRGKTLLFQVRLRIPEISVLAFFGVWVQGA